jgi:2-polyprenyl-3-methyl-5-hydroxy-6-metoxy-1,4-benzoquinol methylase
MTALTTVPVSVDSHVEVRRDGSSLSARRRSDGRVAVSHGLGPGEVDDDLAEALSAVLAPLTDDAVTFEQAFTGVVLTSDTDPSRCWESFYRRSLARLDDPARTGYVEVHRHALRLLAAAGSVLDLGCSFGFLSLALARGGTRVVAADVSPGTVRLVDAMARRLGVRLGTRRTTGTEVPLPAGAFDAVALLHVLEHVDAATGDELLREALRLARRRVVVAVPYEDVPTALYGHVRRFTPAELAMPVPPGWTGHVEEHHGGWLVLDRT